MLPFFFLSDFATECETVIFKTNSDPVNLIFAGSEFFKLKNI